MDNTILEVVIALVLIYAVLSLLVMKVQELLAGSALHYRAGVLHTLVFEAVGHNEDLRRRVLANPLIFALFQGSTAEPGLVKDSGPSSIPPELFARALLAELNGGTHPALKFAAPSAFMAAQAPDLQGTQASPVDRVWRSLAVLLPGREANWPAFETAIARWFQDIGDRSDGWFKRKATTWTLITATLLCGLLNVDTFHIAQTLGSDSALRLGLADLAARVVSAREAGGGSAAPALAPAGLASRPSAQVSSGMSDAMLRLNDAFARDKAIGLYRGNLVSIKDHCSIVLESRPCSDGMSDDKSSSVCTEGVTVTHPKAGKTAPPPGVLPSDGMLANSDIWVQVLPILQTRIETAQLLPAQQAERTYRRAFACVAHMASWVRSATVASADPSVRTTMNEAVVALDAAKTGLLTLIDRQRPSASLKRAFLADPEAFDTCAAEARTRTAFDACLERELKSGVLLPIFHGGANNRAQFCRVAASAAIPAQQGSLESSVPWGGGACSARFAGNEALGVPALMLAPREGPLPAWALWALGVLASTVFVSLGAPFWFDLLGKVVKLRAAGGVRSDEGAAAKPGGGLPPASPAPGAAPGVTTSAVQTGPFADARNRFEDSLLPADIVRLQLRLQVNASGRLDTPTRQAIADFCRQQGVAPAVDELSPALFQQIVGRAATAAAANTSSGRVQAGQQNEFVPLLAKTLGKALGFTDRVREGETVLTPELRALTVLYRHKREGRAGAAGLNSTAFELSRSNPAQLDELAPVLIDEIVKLPADKVFVREQLGWMDWAIGELGQVERGASTRAASNPRICEYLDTAVAGSAGNGDNTAWCGAFAAWVLRRHLDSLLPNDRLRSRAAPPASPLRAANWKDWGAAATSPQFGDIVLFKPTGPDSSGHVAFVVAQEGGRVWALGGNQTKLGRVCVTSFPASEVIAVRTVDDASA